MQQKIFLIIVYRAKNYSKLQWCWKESWQVASLLLSRWHFYLLHCFVIQLDRHLATNGSPGTTLSCFTFNEQNENICPSLKISQMLEHELNCIRGMLFDKVHPFRTANQKWREKHFQDMKSSFKEHPDFDLSVNTWLLYQTNIRLYKNSATPQTTFLAHLLFYTLIYEYRLHEYTS